jgi:hypothetical protein
MDDGIIVYLVLIATISIIIRYIFLFYKTSRKSWFRDKTNRDYLVMNRVKRNWEN